jgi:signal transduction histidine kinase
MSKKGGSITAQLVWRVIAVQAVIMISAIVVLTYTLYKSNVSYIDERTASHIADALSIDSDGKIALGDSQRFRALLRSSPGLWFVVVDEKGRRLEYGEVPEVYRPLTTSLSRLRQSEVHDNYAPYALTMRTDMVDASIGRVRMMSGGSATTNPRAMLLFVSHYLIWRMAIPLAVVTLIILPWLIRRAISGVEDVAGQAKAIDIDERGMRLEDQSVPRELQPLVKAFNATLERLGEGYDARDRFLAGAAHELRVPIAILEARIETLVTGAARLRLLADVGRLSNLAEQLLDLQRLGKQQGCRLEPIDLTALSEEVTADVAPLVIDAGYDIALNAPDVPVMIMGDRLSLYRVLTNLIQNAVAHGGGRGHISVDVETSGAFGVRDEGPGIPPEERFRIFEPFYRLRQSAVGVGLGLHLVREIVMLHGGRIEVTEADTGGAWFRVRLRRATGPRDPIVDDI